MSGVVNAHIQAVLPELRAEAEARMNRSCVIREVTGVTADPVTGADVVTYGEPIYEGKCRLRRNDAAAFDHEVGGATVVASRQTLHIPFDTPRVPPGAVVFFEDDVPAYRTTDVADGDDTTARRYMVEVVTS